MSWLSGPCNVPPVDVGTSYVTTDVDTEPVAIADSDIRVDELDRLSDGQGSERP